jgi:hypothetical protein
MAAAKETMVTIVAAKATSVASLPLLVATGTSNFEQQLMRYNTS